MSNENKRKRELRPVRYFSTALKSFAYSILNKSFNYELLSI